MGVDIGVATVTHIGETVLVPLHLIRKAGQRINCFMSLQLPKLPQHDDAHDDAEAIVGSNAPHATHLISQSTPSPPAIHDDSFLPAILESWAKRAGSTICTTSYQPLCMAELAYL